MTSPGETAMDHQMTADDGDMADRGPVPTWTPLTEDPQPTAPAMAWESDAAVMPEAAVMPDAQPESVQEPPAASAADGMSTRWREILAMFVDDPRASAELAASVVDDGIRDLVAFMKEQQDSLLAAWHGQDAGTEELRTAVQHYRAFGARVEEFQRED
jgi:hypothetical protein